MTTEQLELLARVERDFTYHAPHGDQAQRYNVIREQAKQLALTLVKFTPQSREQSLALTELEKSVMFANAAIARNESVPESYFESTKAKHPEITLPPYQGGHLAGTFLDEPEPHQQ